MKKTCLRNLVYVNYVFYLSLLSCRFSFKEVAMAEHGKVMFRFSIEMSHNHIDEIDVEEKRAEVSSY